MKNILKMIIFVIGKLYIFVYTLKTNFKIFKT